MRHLLIALTLAVVAAGCLVVNQRETVRRISDEPVAADEPVPAPDGATPPIGARN